MSLSVFGGFSWSLLRGYLFLGNQGGATHFLSWFSSGVGANRSASESFGKMVKPLKNKKTLFCLFLLRFTEKAAGCCKWARFTY